MLAHKSGRFSTGEEQSLGETLTAVVSGRNRLPGLELTPTERFAKKIAEPIQNNFRVHLANRLGGSEKLDLAKVQSVELLASIK